MYTLRAAIDLAYFRKRDVNVYYCRVCGCAYVPNVYMRGGVCLYAV